MKLASFLDHQGFNELRSAIGAPLSTFRVRIALPAPIFRPKPTPPVTIPLPVEGLEVNRDEILVHADSTLLYKGNRVLVHIRDATVYEPRFHISNCSTLIDMKLKGRFARYVVSESQDGNFYVRMGSGPLTKKRLAVCQYCLGNISWNGFDRDRLSRERRLAIVSSFSIPEFFKKYPISLHPVRPLHSVDTAPLNDYPVNWESIANDLKSGLNYRCQECKLVIGELRKKYLHVHHINGNKNECTQDNLRCLCIRCHSNQPFHEHMKSSPELHEFNKIFPII